MGFWVGIKKALNSTVGTSDFAPLDKVFLKQKQLVASDSPYLTIMGGSKVVPLPTSGSNTVYTTLPHQIQMVNGGSARISVELSRSASSVSTYLQILVNGTEQKSLNSGANDDGYYLVSTDITFAAGDVISFKIGGYRNASAYYKNLKMNGQVVDSSLIKIIAI